MLFRSPIGQRLVAYLLLGPNYHLPPAVDVVFEGTEHVPEEPVIFAMNHTDRYNYWPFQWQLWREGRGFTATWVKGKYYENRLLGAFMDSMNNIPLPSRGYVFSSQFRQRIGAPARCTSGFWIRELI